jgi:hypothetical protein
LGLLLLLLWGWAFALQQCYHTKKICTLALRPVLCYIPGTFYFHGRIKKNRGGLNTQHKDIFHLRSSRK